MFVFVRWKWTLSTAHVLPDWCFPRWPRSGIGPDWTWGTCPWEARRHPSWWTPWVWWPWPAGSPADPAARAQLQIKILGNESFTRWLVWDASASIRELGKIRKFLCPHHLQVPKVQFCLPSSIVWVSPPPHIVSTTEAAFRYPFWVKQQFIGSHHLPKFWGKKP